MNDPSNKDIMDAVLFTQDQLSAVRGESMTPNAISAAVATGVLLAVSDPKVWASAVIAIQHHARNEAGGWLLSGIRAFFAKAFWIVLIGMSVYMVGGWAALAAVIKVGAAVKP